MIKLLDVALPSTAQTQLKKFQIAIDILPDYAQRVASAKSDFAKRNKASNKTFQKVRDTLTLMCSGARRCCYCEDSVADEVEHIYPKDLYPQKVFIWSNYLYACGPCNGPKNNQFAVIPAGSSNLIEVQRKKDDPVVPLIEGQSALIDPRCEDPLDFLELDLLGTFFFNPRRELDAVNEARARYTIKVLRLNNRDYLVEARRSYYGTYRARLVEYIHKRDHGSLPQQLGLFVEAIKHLGHPAVWLEMKRQCGIIPELSGLFDQAPEALSW